MRYAKAPHMNFPRLVEAAVVDAEAGRRARKSTLRFTAALRGTRPKRARGSWSATAEATLVLHGTEVTGVCLLGDRVYHVAGECQRLFHEHLTLSLTLTDAISGAVNFSLVGALRGESLAGNFVGTLPGLGLSALMGRWRAPKLWWQVPPPEHECGALLYDHEGITEYPNANGRVRMRIRRYERCVEVEILDPEGRSLTPPRIVHLDEDLNHAVNEKVRVLVYDAPDPGTPMPMQGGGELVRFGEFKFIAVQGCTRPRLFQFVRLVIVETAPDGTRKPEHELWAWRTDDAKMPLPIQGPDGAVIWDHPGVANRWPAKPAGTVADVIFTLETFVCCDGTLLGYVAWGFTLRLTYGANQAPGVPVVIPTAPTWHPKEDSPRAAAVTCPE